MNANKTYGKFLYECFKDKQKIVGGGNKEE